jgi:predicted amidohydrolase YtcJ
VTRILLRGGRVHASDDLHATALCLEDGTIVWTGSDDAASGFEDGADRVVELAGRLVTPAFVDAHAHLAQTGFAAASVDLSAAASLHEALDMVASAANGSANAVVLGFGWDDTTWPEQRPFTRGELDRATGGRACMLSRVDEHSAVVSSAFLDAVPEVAHAEGYDASGFVARDAHHAARAGLFRLQPPADREDAILLALQDAARHGIGMVHELGAPHICPPEDLAVSRALTERAPLPEVVGYWGELGGVERAVELGCEGAAGDLCMDGSIGSRTTALCAPYADADTSGHLYLDADQVAEHVVACTRAGIQAGFHVIGDRAVAEVVAGLEAAARQLGTAAVAAGRHRLEHVEMASPEQMRALAGLGVAGSMQPMFDAYWGGTEGLYAQRLGAQRARPMNAFASMRSAGVQLAFGSDTPVTPFDPWAGVRAAAHHRTPSERIGVEEAFEAYTRGGWRAARRDSGGVIAIGAPASLAVWDAADAGTGRLPDVVSGVELPTCAMTIVAGEVAFELEGALT